MDAAHIRSPRRHLLIVAYGNELMGDDAAGPTLGRLLERHPIANAEVIVLHQLLPELAEPLSRALYAVFVDARAPDGDRRTHLRRMPSHCGASPGIGHISDPSDLLAMAEALYGHAPMAWVLSLPTEVMELGASLTPVARRGVRNGSRAVRRLAKRIERPRE